MKVDEESKKIENDVDEITDTKDEDKRIDCEKNTINSVDTLEKKKREANEFFAENNHAHTQSFIQEAQNVNYYINNMVPIKTTLSVEKQFNLCDAKNCIDFVTEFKETEYFYTAFILLIYQKVNVTDMRELKELLLECLPGEKFFNVDEKKEYVGPYVALDSVLSVINAKMYQQDKIKYVGFGENRRKILKNIMEQFPDLQKVFIDFMQLILSKKYYRSYFYMLQMAKLIEELYIESIIDVKNKILPRLCRYETNMRLLGTCFANLFQHEHVKSEVKSILMDWLNLENSWLWKSTALAYVQLKEIDDKVYFENRMINLIAYKIQLYKYKDYQFLVELILLSESFRNLVCKVWQIELFKANNREKENELCQAFMYLLCNCYYRVNSNNFFLFFVICDTKEQLLCLKKLYKRIMNNYYLRLQLFSLLKAYIKEVNGYSYTNMLVKRMAGFFSFLMIHNRDFKNDIDDLIKQFPNDIAAKLDKIMSL